MPAACADALVADLAPCAASSDSLLSSAGDSGCLLTSHVAAAAAALDAE